MAAFSEKKDVLKPTSYPGSLLFLSSRDPGSEVVLKPFSVLMQARERKHLLEFLEDYDDDKDDPKYYK